MAPETEARSRPPARLGQGFSLLELLASVAIISLLMAAVFSFMYQAQRRFQGNAVVSESNQTARAALEVMTQEIGQAGFNPPFSPNKTSSVAITANADPNCLTLNNINGIHINDWVQVDTGSASEIAQVVGISGTPPAVTSCTTPGPNQIYATLEQNHDGSSTPFPIISYKMPFPAGILQGTGTSNDNTLEFYGDIYNDGTIQYLVYSLAPTTSPATTVTVNGTTYTLYNLRRSITPVTWVAGATNNPSSPLAQNVLYNTTLAQGPTGLPIFAYTTVQVGVVPNLITVVGTIQITLSVAVNPKSLETNRVEWYTMATQIRPLNLSAAVAINGAGGSRFMSKTPPGLPMTFPTGY